MNEEKLYSILKENFGHKDFRLNQKKIIESVLSGHDCLAIMPTGGGKSVCYQVPALYFDGLTIVISPLISLMRDQVLNLEQNGIKASFYNSELDSNEKREVLSQIKNGEVKLLYLSPEGLLSQNLLNFLINEVSVSLIAIDEAHCVSQWGHEFRKDYMRLNILKQNFTHTPIMALTATADSKTQQDIIKQLELDNPAHFVSSFDRPNIKYSIYEREDEIKQLDDFIKTKYLGKTGVVYCLSRKKVESVASKLRDLGHNTVIYHAGLSPQAKLKAQIDFNKEDDIIVVATIAFGMGIDKPDVRFVAHLDLPKSIESYYQETGRAGRDGEDSEAWMVYGLQDVIKLSQMLENTDADEIYKSFARSKLDAMLGLCEGINCRRKYLLSYFNEILEEDCGHCDICLDGIESIDASVNAQKLLSTIYRTGQRFGAGYIIDVLRGSQNAKVIERSHDKLSVYGIGKEESKNYWNKLLRQLLSLKYIQVSNWEYRTLALTQECSALLKGNEVFKMRKHLENKGSSSKRRKVKTEDLNHDRLDLFEQLRDLRLKLAKEENLAPYMVFNDKSLHDMCLLLPRNEDEFLMVNGVGKSKCEKYAHDFLTLIQSHS